MSARVAIVAGCGGVLGGALGAEFLAAGYAVAGLRRTPVRPSEVACDFSDPAGTHRAVGEIIDRLGPPDVLVFNAGRLDVTPFLEAAPDAFSAAWAAGPGGAAACAQAVLPAMLERGSGCMLFTGATASLRGAAHFAAMAAGKFALRGLAQSLAREFQPKGIHVAHVVLDGVLRGSRAAQRFGTTDSSALDPAEVATAYRLLAEQPRRAWSHEIDLRPQAEKL